MNPELTHIDNCLGGSSAEAATVSDLCLWVNSDQLTTHQVALPDTPKSKWMALLPWILEDELLLPVEEVHLVICAVDAERNASVLAVPKKEMYRLQLLLEDQPNRIASLLPDVFALPLEEGFVTLAQQGDRLLVRTGLYQGFSGTADFVWQMLSLRQSQGEIFQIQCFGVNEESVPDWAMEIASFNENPINWQFAEANAETNLLIGDFRSKTGATALSNWMPSFGLGAIALCLLLSFAVVDHLKTGQELTLINQQLAREFEANFGVSLSAPERVQNQGAEILRSREQRYLGLADSVVPIAEVLDTALSSCSNCNLASVQIEPDSATLVMQQNAGVISSLQAQQDFSLTQGQPNEQQQVVVNIRRQSL